MIEIEDIQNRHDAFFETNRMSSKIKRHMPTFIRLGNAIQGKIDGGGYCNTDLRYFIKAFFAEIGTMIDIIEYDKTVLLDQEMKDGFKDLKEVSNKLRIKLKELTPFSVYNLASKKVIAIALLILVGLGAILGFKYFIIGLCSMLVVGIGANLSFKYLLNNTRIIPPVQELSNKIIKC